MITFGKYTLLLILSLNINTLYCQNNIYNVDFFFGETNDILYRNNQEYSISQSPLSDFADYKYIYPQFFVYNSCRVTYESVIDEKRYIARWAIMNDSLYLCSTTWNCNVGHNEEMVEYYIYMSNPFRYDEYLLEKIYNSNWLESKESINYLFTKDRSKWFNGNKNVMNPPLEKLTGMKFRQSPCFPYSIIKIPVTSDGVIAAVWFSGTIDVKNIYSHPFSAYERITFKNGKINSTKKIIPASRTEYEYIPMVLKPELTDSLVKKQRGM